MATKKKSGSKNSDALRQMREGGNASGEARPDKAAQRAEEKKLKAEAIKREKEAKAAQKKADKEAKAAAKAAEKEAAKRPNTVLTDEQMEVIAPKGEPLPQLEKLSEAESIKRADAGDKELRGLEQKFLRAAIIIRDFKVNELWKFATNPDTGERGFKSLSKWIASVMPLSRSEGYKALAVGENLIPHIPESDLKDMPARNLQLLVNVPKIRLSDPEIIGAAKKSEKALRKTLSEKAPEAHIEENGHVFVPASAKSVVDEAIEAITELHECENRGSAMEALALYFLQGPTEHPAYKGMNNKDAYDQLKHDREHPSPELIGDEVPAEQEQEAAI